MRALLAEATSFGAPEVSGSSSSSDSQYQSGIDLYGIVMKLSDFHPFVVGRSPMSSSYENSLALGADLPPQIAGVFDNYMTFRTCESWDSGRADPVENTPVSSDIPALIFAGQYDPVTPPAWGRLAAATLSRHFFYEFSGMSHGIMRSNECGLSIGLQFLADPLTEPDSSCMERLEPLVFE